MRRNFIKILNKFLENFQEIRDIAFFLSDITDVDYLKKKSIIKNLPLFFKNHNQFF